MSPGPRVVDPPELARPRGFAHGIVAPAGARLLFVAGQVGWDREARLVGDSFVAQWERAIDNVLAVVRAAGGSPPDVVRMTVYVTDKREYEAALSELGAVWRERFAKHYPAMALVEVAALLEPGAKVEIEATAALPPE
ncbi:MAG: RidA family protein [Thermoanaerobaculia bacterium]